MKDRFICATEEYCKLYEYVSAPYIRKYFFVENFKSAKLKICGLGLYELFLNGQKITKGDNLVTIYDRKAFSLDYFTVYAENYEANVTIEPQFESLSDGYNYLLITVKAKNKVDFEHLQIVFDLQQVELPAEEGCSSTVSLWGGLALLPALALVYAKRSEKE